LELLDVDDDPRSPERGQFQFVQSLIREVAYQRLNRQDRRSRHLAAAEYFERFDDPELAGVVAGHLIGAYGASPEGAEREELAHRALQGLVDAANRAADLGSHVQAMGLLDQAVELSVDESRRASYRLQAAGYANLQSAVERGIAYIEAARSHFEEIGDVDGVRQAVTIHSDILNSHFRSPEALEVIEPVFREVRTIDDPTTVRLAAEAARSYALVTNHAPAIEAVIRLLPAASALELTEVTLDSLVTQATALAWSGRVTESRVLFRGAAAVAEDGGLLRVAGRAINNLSATLYLDDPREAKRLSERLLELTYRIGDFGWMMRTTFDTATSWISDGRYEDALGLLAQFDEDQLSDFWKDWWEYGRALIDLRTGRSPDAFARVMDLVVIHDDVTDPQFRAGMDQTKCQAFKAVGRWDDAFDLAMRIDQTVTGAGLYEAAQAAAWTRSLDRINQVIEATAENTDKGILPDGVRIYVDAIRSALSGDRERATQLFVDLIALFEPVAVEEDMAIVRTTFAMLVGQDNPAAARAAQDAYDWLSATGTTCYLNVWAEGLPDQTQLEQPAVG
jgi:hypothetical protein